MRDHHHGRDYVSRGVKAWSALLKALWVVECEYGVVCDWHGCPVKVTFYGSLDLDQRRGRCGDHELRHELHRRAILAKPRGRHSPS
jgi:hypothetical protein